MMNIYRNHRFFQINKVIFSLALCLLIFEFSRAHSTHEAIPEKITVDWTKKQIKHPIPSIDIEDTSPRLVLKELNSRDSNPSRIISIDYKEVVFQNKVKITYRKYNVPWIEVVRHVASKIEADVEIVPGKVILRSPTILDDPKPKVIDDDETKTDLETIRYKELKQYEGIERVIKNRFYGGLFFSSL